MKGIIIMPITRPAARADSLATSSPILAPAPRTSGATVTFHPDGSGSFSHFAGATTGTFQGFERVTGTAYDDTRSDNKGAEPESVIVKQVGNKMYAFVALERGAATII